MSIRTVPTGPLNRTALAEALAVETGVSICQATDSVNALLDIITRTVTAGHPVTVTNFGSWYPHDRAARNARNPQTGETFVAPASRGIRFRISPRLAAVVRAGDPATATVRKRRPTS
ncbi:HU family DNA-binding protein [Streptomyces lydicus]|uniref:HU family DNA-binding protein n=1 Tax=Streptomyces lydicus TaxID=47763 RepID=UPI00371DEC8C